MLYERLGLNDDVTFKQHGESMFAVRYRAGDAVGASGDVLDGRVGPSVPYGPLDAMQEMPEGIYAISDPVGRRTAIADWVKQWHPGGTASPGGRWTPTTLSAAMVSGEPARTTLRSSATAGTGCAVPEGAELLRIRPDGRQEVAAVHRGGEWSVVVEQPPAAAP